MYTHTRMETHDIPRRVYIHVIHTWIYAIFVMWLRMCTYPRTCLQKYLQTCIYRRSKKPILPTSLFREFTCIYNAYAYIYVPMHTYKHTHTKKFLFALFLFVGSWCNWELTVVVCIYVISFVFVFVREREYMYKHVY